MTNNATLSQFSKSEDSDSTGSNEASEQQEHESENGNPVDDSSNWKNKCLSFTVRGEWGHFRRVDGNIAKRTFHIMPRTTAAGLMAAILGYDRDSYYDIFGEDSSRIAISLNREARTMSLPMLEIKTKGEEMYTHDLGEVEIKTPSDSKRVRRNYEMLVDPSYRIDVSLKDQDVYQNLKRHLEEGKSVYTPSLGKSECLATIDYHGEFDVRSIDEDVVDVQSAVPRVGDRTIPTEGVSYRNNRVPAYMEQTNDGGSSGRRVTKYTTYWYRSDSGPVRVQNVDAESVDGRPVVFE